MCCFFFFSSRRRHTRLTCDWSSDVCSSDLGVRVNALAPGLVKTDFARALWERSEDKIAARLPLGRLGVPDDIAKAALFLCSDASSWLTGHVLVIDGGALVVPSGGI